jgi:hypothetical protein
VNVVNNAISTIDKTGAFKGSFETAAEANAALGTGQPGQYYLNFQTDSAWFWNNQMVPPAWTDSRVTAARYNALTQAQKDAQRWNIIPG